MNCVPARQRRRQYNWNCAWNQQGRNYWKNIKLATNKTLLLAIRVLSLTAMSELLFFSFSFWHMTYRHAWRLRLRAALVQILSVFNWRARMWENIRVFYNGQIPSTGWSQLFGYRTKTKRKWGTWLVTVQKQKENEEHDWTTWYFVTMHTMTIVILTLKGGLRENNSAVVGCN